MAQGEVIDGKAFAETLRAQVRDAAARLRQDGLTPGLAVVLVGENPASEVYVRNKVKATHAAGIESFEHYLPANVEQDELLALVRRLNDDAAVHGILVQLPLPPHLDETAVIETVRPDKDVDGLHVLNAGRLITGGEGLVPCTPLGCLLLLRSRLGSLEGLKALIIGRSRLVGKPLAHLLLGENCTVTIAHSRTRDLAAECRQGDILVAAVGRHEMVRGDWIKPGATVIDVGINRFRDEHGRTRLGGDVCFDEAVQVAGAITPVPGGVGPMTIAVLLRNAVVAACRQTGRAVPFPGS